MVWALSWICFISLEVFIICCWIGRLGYYIQIKWRWEYYTQVDKELDLAHLSKGRLLSLQAVTILEWVCCGGQLWWTLFEHTVNICTFDQDKALPHLWASSMIGGAGTLLFLWVWSIGVLDVACAPANTIEPLKSSLTPYKWHWATNLLPIFSLLCAFLWDFLCFRICIPDPPLSLYSFRWSLWILIICIFMLFGSKCFLFPLNTFRVTVLLFRRVLPSLRVSQDFLLRISQLDSGLVPW